MNERILELYDAARFQAGSEKQWSTTNLDVAERFAQLILFECVKIAVFRGDAKTGRAIKEHFGVEE